MSRARINDAQGWENLQLGCKRRRRGGGGLVVAAFISLQACQCFPFMPHTPTSRAQQSIKQVPMALKPQTKTFSFFYSILLSTRNSLLPSLFSFPSSLPFSIITGVSRSSSPSSPAPFSLVLYPHANGPPSASYARYATLRYPTYPTYGTAPSHKPV